MIFRFVYSLWTGNPPLERADPLDAKVEEFEAQARSRDAEQTEGQRKETSEARENFIFFTITQEQRRSIASLLNAIDDAILAARHALADALRDESQARAELEAAQGGAIVLSDGRRVYFSADGRLYGEDHQVITSAAALEEARRLRDLNPAATTYETLQDRERQLRLAAERSQFLADLLDRLDTLREKLKSGEISPEQLAQAEREAYELIHSMPPEARSEYARMRHHREGGDIAYHAVENFGQNETSATPRPAAVALPGESDAAHGEHRAPAYKGAPDF